MEAGPRGVGGERRGPDEHVGRGDVVEEVGDAAAARGRNGDVEDALGAGVGFFEGEVADVGPDAGFEHVDVEEVAFADEAGQAPERSLHFACLVARDESLLFLRG